MQVFNPVSAPEPSTLAFFGMGLQILAAPHRRVRNFPEPGPQKRLCAPT
jgi:hypothetical protein